MQFIYNKKPSKWQWITFFLLSGLLGRRDGRKYSAEKVKVNLFQRAIKKLQQTKKHYLEKARMKQ